MIITREDFVGVVKNSVAGLGFAAEASLVTFPIDVFLVDSDISPVERGIDRIVAGLTRWEPEVKEGGLLRPPRATVRGATFADALARMNRMFLRRNWGDGLPLLPPTEEAVTWMLRGSDLPSDTVIGKFLPQGGIVTLETLAVALTMAGGRPEYLPILIAAVEAILDPELMHDKWQSTSASTFPVVIVNGPIAEQVGLNSGFGLLGPDPAHPAGASIGRAIRLLQQNVGGALPGTGTMASFGGMRYTNAVFAEDEAGLPEGWEPLNVERFGYARGTNSVAVYPATGASNILRRGTGKETLEEEALGSLHRIAGYLQSPNPHYLRGYDFGTPGALLMTRVVARQLDSLGWSKEKIKAFLWEHSKLSLEDIQKTGMLNWINHVDRKTIDPPSFPWPISRSPDNLMLVVAGGGHPTHAYWMQAVAPQVISRRIQLPRRWEQLIAEAGAEAEEDGA